MYGSLDLKKIQTSFVTQLWGGKSQLPTFVIQTFWHHAGFMDIPVKDC